MSTEKQFLTKEELTSLQESKTKLDQFIYSLGEIEAQFLGLEMRKTTLKEEIIKHQTTSNTLAKSIEEKYGAGSVSLEDGEFIPSLTNLEEK